MPPATHKALEPAAALLEQAYRLALVLQTAHASDTSHDAPCEWPWISQELLSVLDEARAALVVAARTPPDASATLPSV